MTQHGDGSNSNSFQPDNPALMIIQIRARSNAANQINNQVWVSVTRTKDHPVGNLREGRRTKVLDTISAAFSGSLDCRSRKILEIPTAAYPIRCNPAHFSFAELELLRYGPQRQTRVLEPIDGLRRSYCEKAELATLSGLQFFCFRRGSWSRLQTLRLSFDLCESHP